jgi:hypothetical protein
MGYRVMDTVDQMRTKYEARRGLEGPFNFSGRVLYYDPKAGEYWDPRTDFFVPNDEVSELQNSIFNILKG